MNQQNIGPQPDESAGDVSAPTVNITQGGARDVFAHTATVTQGGVGDVKADNMIVRQGGVQKVEATNVTVRQGGVVQLKTHTADIAQSAVVLAQADQVTCEGGTRALGVMAGSATFDGARAQAVISRGSVGMEQSATGAVFAPQVMVKNSAVGLLVAQHVEGDVRPMFGTEAAVAFGAAFGAAFGLVFALTRGIKRQRRR